MIGWLGGAYLWVLALHIISVIAWMAGMLYLPRLYVYHTEAQPGGEFSEKLKVMERRLLRAIINPAMIASWTFGLMLFLHLGAWSMGWMHVKLTLVVIMSAFHGYLSRWRKDFERDANRRSQTFYRMMNEVPTVLMIGIVIFVVVKPF
ncbi:protoporphyrinogen oxidase HemJ [Ferruginivarius sediminum]|uniref:Protoporphyrinogen IX oxidase n=1 Tax=Ferruginivarius sediminum TaxID=2661937 RepID=A0A369TK25_9PROT|nr:protoporphyrinogen oxidase HemJ [Ferruginivarius sediminum]RDD63266.1 protoporphyrinogen oxidase HemJ [Ferruginivarius sediminum]